MSEPANAFDWRLFFRRMLGGLVIMVMWMVQDGLKHDYLGVTIALLSGVVMSVLCYFWVRRGF
jgi:hypothetical protein